MTLRNLRRMVCGFIVFPKWADPWPSSNRSGFVLLKYLDDLGFAVSFAFHLVLSALAVRTNFSIATVFRGGAILSLGDRTGFMG
jgi:hypothetical protein